MYLIQARLLAAGRLWLPQHPLADFFETFHVFTKPVYAPIYFPGTALLYVLPIKIGRAPWLMSVLVCSGVVTLAYVVFTRLLDGVAGALAALMALAVPQIHFLSIMAMSHPVALLQGLAMTWAWLRWRRAAALGRLAGWSL